MKVTVPTEAAAAAAMCFTCSINSRSAEFLKNNYYLISVMSAEKAQRCQILQSSL